MNNGGFNQFQTGVQQQPVNNNNGFFTGAQPQMQPMGGGFQNAGGFPNQFQTGMPQQPMGQPSMGFNPMGAGMFSGPPAGLGGGGGANKMPEFLRKKQEEQKQQVQKSDLSGLMSMDPSKFNLGYQDNSNQAAGASARGSNPFDNFGGSSHPPQSSSSGYTDAFSNSQN